MMPFVPAIALRRFGNVSIGIPLRSLIDGLPVIMRPQLLDLNTGRMEIVRDTDYGKYKI